MQFRAKCKDYCHSMKREKHDFGCQGWISTSTKHLLLKQSQKKQQMHRSTSQEAAKVVGASWTEALEIWTPWGNFEEGFNHRLSDTIKCRRSTYKQFMGYAYLYANHQWNNNQSQEILYFFFRWRSQEILYCIYRYVTAGLKRFKVEKFYTYILNCAFEVTLFTISFMFF